MNRFDARPRRWSGPRIMLWSLMIGLCGIAPLLLYAVMGPADGNPIGLGLLAMLAGTTAQFGILVGLIKMSIECFARGSR